MDAWRNNTGKREGYVQLWKKRNQESLQAAQNRKARQELQRIGARAQNRMQSFGSYEINPRREMI
jgi:hypothetical protein